VPRASVIIPAYHSSRTLGACLDAVSAQTDRDHEVIVVNSSPESWTEALVEGFSGVRFEQSPHRLLPHAARNRGVQLADGDLLVFTDPDCEPDRDWLECLVSAHERGHGAVAGSIDPGRRDRRSIGMHLVKFHWRLSALPPGPTDLAQTANASYTRSVWERVGPFDGSRFSGDVLLSRLAARAGDRPWFEPRARVRHHQSGGPRTLMRERLLRGGDAAATRVEAERWSKWRIAGYLGAAPLLPALLVARTGRDAARAGLLADFAATLPLQVGAQAAWALGEARWHARALVG
jgi:glycosyltransferase involved in cell wall biosynthesis